MKADDLVRLIFFLSLCDLLFHTAVKADDERVHVGIEAPLVHQKPGGFNADSQARTSEYKLR